MLICSYLPISALYTIYLEILDIRKEVVTVFGPVHCQVICPPPLIPPLCDILFPRRAFRDQ